MSNMDNPQKFKQDARDDNSYGSPSGGGGKGLERLNISTGMMVIIDQFMLANDQFTSQLDAVEQASDKGAALSVLTANYGGCAMGLPAGDYNVYRDPYKNIIVLCPAELSSKKGPEESHPHGMQEEAPFDFDSIVGAKGNLAPKHHVFVDTRCLVFVDASFLFNRPLMSNYRKFRKQGDDKPARDLLRSNGGAVRYGFNRHGDELGVFQLPDEPIIALWPDIIE